MSLQSAKKIPLNRFSYSVRASQTVTQYGVGAIVDFSDQSLMTAAPEYWKEHIKPIHDERLEKLLHVDYFGLPLSSGGGQYTGGIAYARFPEWYFCPKCHKFQPLSAWIKEYRAKAKQAQLDKDPDMVKYLRCSTCKADLVVTRIVSVCERGHIDDFPWVKWVHCRNTYGGAKPICGNPVLTFKTSASSTEGLEGLSVTCETCKARATLKGAFDKDIFKELDDKYGDKYGFPGFHCTGRHPWKNEHESCGAFPRIVQRSSSSVYFPITASSLVIPPYSSLLTTSVEGSKAFEIQKNTIAELKKDPAMASQIQRYIASSIDRFAKEIALELGVAEGQVKAILERKWMLPTNEEQYSTASVKYRSEEYAALSGSVTMTSDDYGDFQRETTDISQYGIPYVSGISLIHKIREVEALIAYSRIKPVEQYIESDAQERAVSIKSRETNWYPANEVRGEGIFIQFDQTAINQWLDSNPEIQKRVELLNENYAKTYFGSMKPRKITGKFLLLHTISHLLIKQLSFECGYGIASLRERLYCSEAEEGCEMAGVLIYTASGDSEGTLGGLVRQGRADVFPGIYKKAIETAMTCANDPVCSLSMGQGRDSLNLSACYSCSLIPETSCEEYNVFLDRATVVGTYESRLIGIYSKQLYEGESWVLPSKNKPKPELDDATDKKDSLFITDYGIDLSEVVFGEVMDSLSEWSESETELQFLKKMKNQSDSFAQKESAHKNVSFTTLDSSETFTCDIMWIESKVAFFTEDNEDGFITAKSTDWRCFLTTEDDITVDKILRIIKEKE